MKFDPIFWYGIFILLYFVAEFIVVVRHGSWKRRFKKDWTFLIILVPYRLVIISPVIEQFLFNRHVGYLGCLVGGILFILATILRTKGHLDLKHGFSPYIEKRDGQELVDKGIYKHIRHPLYLAVICFSFACPIFLHAYYSLALTALTITGLMIRIRHEERFLKVHMPGYSDYIKRTWALIPRIY